MAGLPKLKEEKSLGVIVKVHPSGVRETKEGHKCIGTGELGDTLMMRTNRTTYIITAKEMKERAKNIKNSTNQPADSNSESAASGDAGAAE